ncbi:hypothetical protein DFH07DRAFT_238817 [Mycena maculata]|uniref:Uncharacterized protein n=1 Tax=Mycena maculata TaxID=230809 RepID=A0AAD7NQA5_9AGAR|nr:hypothetical protein DFH07DRAFT_238817 [Mycena maculata]
MTFINPPAANQATLLFTFVISASSLVPLLALLILVMKRKRPPPTASDHEDQRSSVEDTPSTTASDNGESFKSDRAPRIQPPPRKRRKAIPRRMLHMKNNMTVWGDRWLPAIQPSTAGSQQGEIDASGMYTISKSPPPAHRTTPLPLSPVVMTSSSASPNPHPLSSDFKSGDDDAPPPFDPPSLDGMFLFGGDTFGLSGGDSLAQLAGLDEGLSYCTFQENPPVFDFKAEVPSSLSHSTYNASPSIPPPSYFSTPCTGHFSDPMAAMDLSLASFSSGLDNSQYPVPGAGSFSDWIPPLTAQSTLPLDNIAHFMDGLPCNSSLSYSSPSQNASDFPTAVWKTGGIQYPRGSNAAMPMVAGHSAPPMYTSLGSPYLAMAEGSYSPVYHRTGSGSPMALYSGHPTQHYSHAGSLSPLVTRTTSSGSLASMYSMDNHSPISRRSSESMMFSRPMSGYSDYGDVDYNYSSPHSGIFTASPGSVSSIYGGGNESSYPVTRNIPLPFHNSPYPNW